MQYEFVHCVIKYGGNMNEQENKENQASSQKSSLLSKFIVFLMAAVVFVFFVLYGGCFDLFTFLGCFNFF